ncbi:hypothetical protein FDECE_2895 [Fusarium decemcellulare]|nr:hypothetical protein FDECE_2895 [Fusarium decemcellulare]
MEGLSSARGEAEQSIAEPAIKETSSNSTTAPLPNSAQNQDFPLPSTEPDDSQGEESSNDSRNSLYSINPSKSSQSPSPDQDTNGLLEPEIFLKAVQALTLDDVHDGSEGYIRGPGRVVYNIYRRGPPENAKYELKNEKTKVFSEGMDPLIDKATIKSRIQVGVTSNMMRAFDSVVCKGGIKGLIPNLWNRGANGRIVRPCLRIKVSWDKGDGTIFSTWEKRQTVKDLWQDERYPINGPTASKTMKVPWNVEIDGTVYLTAGENILKLDWAILRAGIRSEEYYNCWAHGERRSRSPSGLLQ